MLWVVRSGVPRGSGPPASHYCTHMAKLLWQLPGPRPGQCMYLIVLRLYLEFFFQLIALSVVLSYPSLIMRFIAAFMLGHLSKMYRRALVESYDVLAQCAAATTRLLSSSVCYANLQNTSDTGLSLRHILHSMRFMTANVWT